MAKRLKIPSLQAIPASITTKWPMASSAALAADPAFLSALPIDHTVTSAKARGGQKAAAALWKEFLSHRLSRYEEDRNQPEAEGTSSLSPYLHFGHISVHQVVADLMAKEKWSEERLSSKSAGHRSGGWGMSAAAEAFLDQIVTWRELGYNMCYREGNYDQYESLPSWAQRTLRDHTRDARPHVYALGQFEAGKTHNPLWNAAQMQLVREGRIHNYLRMLWGKKILEWSASPQEAMAIMMELNNKYALDGRDPNSYSRIFWVLGRYDRPWGPERPIFGKIRYMSSANTARKVKVQGYIGKYAPEDSQ
ncbi:MAG: hypothetical protein NTY64_03550 [Deltaproteobacteria bacterium]|nr:hypothetical protein [Deltaproteobacteria bacterium]